MHENAHNRRHAASIAIATIFTLFLPYAASANGRSSTAIVFPSDKVKVIVSDDGDSFDLRTHDERLTLMEFHEPVVDVDSASAHYYAKRRGKHLVEVKIRKGATPDASTLTVETQSGAIVNIGLIPTEEATEVPKYVEVETISREALERRKRDRQIAEQLLTREYWRAVPTSVANESAAPVEASILGIQTTTETDPDTGESIHRRFLMFFLKNHRSVPFRLTAIHIMENKRGHHLADVVSIDQRGSTEGGRLLATVKPNGEIHGQVLVPHEVSGEKHELALTFTDAASAFPLIAATQQADFVLVPNDQAARVQRELALGRQVSVGVHALSGAMWVANPQNADTLAATGVNGFGLRVGYGLHTLFAIEGELALARTGDAQFNDTWQGVPGELTRRATVGRLLMGGVVRLGRYYIPTMRVSLGFQGSNHTAGFVPNGGTMEDGPADGFEANMILSIGLGFDARLSQHWLLGLRAGFAQSIGAESRMLEGGLHVSYGWNPTPLKFF